MKFLKLNEKFLKTIFILLLFVTLEIDATSSKTQDIFNKDQVSKKQNKK